MIANKKISIIVPNYKNEKYLEKTLKSLVEQTYKNIEIIIVCDKPEEDCDKLVESYTKKDNRIIYIKNEEKEKLKQDYKEHKKQVVIILHF